jgi:hypothetical protein
LEKAGLKYIDLTFREKIVHDALLYNVKTAIKSKESIPDSREYGKSLINESFRDSTVKSELK